MKQNFDNNSFRDFEYIPGLGAWARAKLFQSYLNDQSAKGQLNYRLVTNSGCGPVLEMAGKKMISLVSNDYLGFTQHPAVRNKPPSTVISQNTAQAPAPHQPSAGTMITTKCSKRRSPDFSGRKTPSFIPPGTPRTALRCNAS